MTVFEGRFTDTAGLKIAVVVARFNDLVTGKLLSGCLDCLSRHGVDTTPDSSQLDVAWVPGSFEIPLVAEVSKGVAAVARDTGVPVIFGVLTTDTLQQALERAGIKSNLGWNYGLQALEMGSLMAAIPPNP